ncbi:MAG: HEAT repeat domain-containing protein [Fibrobacteria bacterium]|nr:HEAT repeat domain-containing protein [Fibrobacteria bacterium]
MTSSSESSWVVFTGNWMEWTARIPGVAPGSSWSSRMGFLLFVGTVLAVVLFTVSILALHFLNDRRLRREKAWKDRWLLQLLDPRAQGKVEPLHEAQFIAFCDLWSQVDGSIRGSLREEMIEAVRRAGTQELCVKFLRKGTFREKLLAAGLSGQLRIRETIEHLLPLADSPDPALSLTACHSILRMDADAHFRDFLPRLLENELWPVAQVHEILSEMPPELVSSRLPSALVEWEPAPPARAVRMLDLLPEDLRAQVIERVFRKSAEIAPETEAALLREIRSPEHLPLARQALTSSRWPVVVAALHTMARMGSREDVPMLSELLGHSEWWVRYRSAQALVRLPGIRPIELELLATRHPDRYGRDMLRFALAEMGMR